ncbi:hypothetical protein A2U01_0118026, partial [Trifolium medium]|nr:hypothetical protein [Trifolium medium]
HCTKDAAAWESLFSERRQMFEELLAIERGNNEAATGKGSKDNPVEY